MGQADRLEGFGYGTNDGHRPRAAGLTRRMTSMVGKICQRDVVCSGLVRRRYFLARNSGALKFFSGRCRHGYTDHGIAGNEVGECLLLPAICPGRPHR